MCFSEFILSTDADADRALLLGFELLLARVECYHFLDLMVEPQLGPQEWLDVLHRRKLVDPTEKQTILEERQDNDEKNKLDKTEEPPFFDTRKSSVPQPEPRHYRINSVDQSVMELQRTYPDLAFRGRPLLPDQPQKAHPTTTGSVADGANLIKESKAASPTVLSGDDGCNDRNNVGVAVPSDTAGLSFKNSDETRVDDDHLSGPQAISLHITLRTAPKAESSMKRGKLHPTTESSDDTQQKSSSENVMDDKPESPSLSSTDEEQQLRALAESMGQPSVQGDEGKTCRHELRDV
ncbi:hypothetical protein ILYODFUR_031186 [Ilyodon furcidens]|uniref:Uncharacterized protein n=1 Tax=Ilyodon furcidens TaxID=33524 RepID=A0ABV0T3F7_9TELE